MIVCQVHYCMWQTSLLDDISTLWYNFFSKQRIGIFKLKFLCSFCFLSMVINLRYVDHFLRELCTLNILCSSRCSFSAINFHWLKDWLKYAWNYNWWDVNYWIAATYVIESILLMRKLFHNKFETVTKQKLKI